MQWWRDAVFYQVYVPSFTDSDGDGIGDLQGIRSRLGYLELLGVDALWLSPIYPSPMVDNGYDVTDHRGVDPVWGDLDAVDELVADAHAHGIRVTVDLVPNHTSDQHAWFRAALASPPGSPERARYHFRPGRGADGAEPPNGWRSVFGGSAWTREPPSDEGPGEWYLHLFSPAQPDLNWTNLEVWADLDKTLRFWLDRGVDGFRIDAAHGMCKQGCDAPDRRRAAAADDDPRFDQDDVHDVHRMIRATLDHYPERVAIGAVGVRSAARFARYVRSDELHLAVDTRLAASRVRRRRGARGDRGLPGAGRLASGPRRRGCCPTTTCPGRRRATAAAPSGRARARAMALVQLALPGAVYLYNGDELGLPDADLPDEARRDAVWHHGEDGRDGCRVPAALGGGPAGLRVHHRRALAADPRRVRRAERGRAARGHRLDALAVPARAGAAPPAPRLHRARRAAPLEWFGAPPGCLAFRRTGTTLVCALNTSAGAGPAAPRRPAAGQRPARRADAAPGHRRLARLISTDRSPPMPPPRESARSPARVGRLPARVGTFAGASRHVRQPRQVSSGSAVMRRRTTAPRGRPAAATPPVAATRTVSPASPARGPHPGQREQAAQRDPDRRAAPAPATAARLVEQRRGRPERVGVPRASRAALGEPLQSAAAPCRRGPAVVGREQPLPQPAEPGSTVSARSTLSAESSAVASVVTSAGSRVPARSGWPARRTVCSPTRSPGRCGARSRTPAVWSSRTTRPTNSPRSPLSSGRGRAARSRPPTGRGTPALVGQPARPLASRS